MIKRLILGTLLAFSFGFIWAPIAHYFELSGGWTSVIAFFLGVLGMWLSLCWYAGKEAQTE